MRIYKRGETWWCWYFQDGKQVRRSTKCRDKRAAESAAREFERVAADPLHPARQTATIADAVKMLVEHRTEESNAGRRSLATVDFYREKGGHWCRILGGEFRLSSLTAAAIDEYVSTRRREGFVDGTIAKELVTMRAALKLAKRAGKWHGDIASIFPVAFAPDYKPRKRVLTVAELYAILAELEPDRAARVAFIVATGARLGETDRAERGDIVKGESFDAVHLRGTKTAGAKRTVPVVYPLARQLLQYALDHAGGDAVLFRTWDKLHRDLDRARRRAGCKAVGCKIKPSRWTKCESLACTQASPAHVTPNDLRRTCATWLRQAGVPLELLAAVLGHADTRMAARVYAELGPAALAARIAATSGCDTFVIDGASQGGLGGLYGHGESVNHLESSGLSGTRTQDQRIKSPTHLIPKPAKPHHKSGALAGQCDTSVRGKRARQ
jgi:integrase